MTAPACNRKRRARFHACPWLAWALLVLGLASASLTRAQSLPATLEQPVKALADKMLPELAAIPPSGIDRAESRIANVIEELDELRRTHPIPGRQLENVHSLLRAARRWARTAPSGATVDAHAGRLLRVMEKALLPSPAAQRGQVLAANTATGEPELSRVPAGCAVDDLWLLPNEGGPEGPLDVAFEHRWRHNYASRITQRKADDWKIRHREPMPKARIAESYDKWYQDRAMEHYTLRCLWRAVWVSRYETTFAEYDRFAEDTGRRKPDDYGWGRGQQPVIDVSWHDAAAYTNWLSARSGHTYRLLKPVEHKWLQVWTGLWRSKCLHTDIENYHGQHGFQGCGAKTGVYRGRPLPVGSLSGTAFGVHDVLGNVGEWLECWPRLRRCAGPYMGRRASRGSFEEQVSDLLSIEFIPGGSRAYFRGFRVARDVASP